MFILFFNNERDRVEPTVVESIKVLRTLDLNHNILFTKTSQVSSSEYFSVCFTENGFKDKDEIFIAASKGISLG